jgi:hypothetical protein
MMSVGVMEAFAPVAVSLPMTVAVRALASSMAVARCPRHFSRLANSLSRLKGWVGVCFATWVGLAVVGLDLLRPVALPDVAGATAGRTTMLPL